MSLRSGFDIISDMQNNYNLTVVIDGKMTPAKRKSVKESLEKLISTLKGKIEKVEDLGEKELAYIIKKSNSGYFFNFKLSLETTNTKNLLSKLQLDDNLLRYLLVRTEEEKKVKKGKSNGKKSK